MQATIEGIYRRGKVVTFLPPGSIDLRARGIDEAQAAEMRARLASIAEDWESPEMTIYDNYDEEKLNYKKY